MMTRKTPKPKPAPLPRYMAMASDSSGAPRCWGSATTEAEAREECAKQLSAYRNEKHALGDPLARDTFTVTVRQIGVGPCRSRAERRVRP